MNKWLKRRRVFEINDFKVIKKDCDVYYYVNKTTGKKVCWRWKISTLKFSKKH